MDIGRWSRKKTVITLRWCLIISVSYMVVFGTSLPEYMTRESLLVGSLMLSNLILMILPRRFFEKSALEAIILVTDTLMVSLGIYLSGKAGSDFYLVYFLVILLASLGGNLKRVVINSLFVTGAYALILAMTGPAELASDSSIMIRIPFIIIISLFYGYMMERERGRKSRVERLEKRTRELEALLEITRLVTSTLDARRVLNLLVQKIETVLDVKRCSVLFIESHNPKVGHVMASQDNTEIQNLEIDLVKYPEVKRAMETGKSVVIDDAIEDPIVCEFGGQLQRAGLNSLLVVPMVHGEDRFGTLLLRAARTKEVFSEWEIKFCQIVANSSANALKNAQLFQELKRQAITDGLTDMYNHRFFQEQFILLTERTRRTGNPLTVLMIDIDNFKWINDYYGHSIGDEAICFIADRLRANSRDGDIVARYGGDEFVWLLADTDLDVATKVANRFRKSVADDSFAATGFLSVSVGVATYPTDTLGVERLLQQADRAMYISKGEGGNRVRSVTNQETGQVLDWGEAR